MCFLIAKNFNKHGCIALQMRGGQELVSLKKHLSKKIDMEKIQLVTISRPSAFGEYEPYHFAKNKEHFEELTLKL